MNRRKWALLILLLLALAVYYKLFYKSFTERVVPKSARSIIALDVKRITNTILWNIITDPDQWKFSSGEKGKTSPRDMFNIPDYVFIFNPANQPVHAWYTVLEIKDLEDFKNGLAENGFVARLLTGNLTEYYSNSFNLAIVQSGRMVLVGTGGSEKKFLRDIASELFIEKQYTSRQKLKIGTEAKSHLAMVISRNKYISNDALLTANFDRKEIRFSVSLSLVNNAKFPVATFRYPVNSFFVLGFTQPPEPILDLIPSRIKSSISKGIGFPIDSLMLKGNSSYMLDLPGFRSRIDSAISYRYDDNFNQVEEKTVNLVHEPSFDFTAKGNKVHQTYQYFEREAKIEKTDSGALFLPVPFVKSYCSQNDRLLRVRSFNYAIKDSEEIFTGLFLLIMRWDKLPEQLKVFIPPTVSRVLSNIRSISVHGKELNGNLLIEGQMRKQENELPLIKL